MLFGKEKPSKQESPQYFHSRQKPAASPSSRKRSTGTCCWKLGEGPLVVGVPQAIVENIKFLIHRSRRCSCLFGCSLADPKARLCICAALPLPPTQEAEEKPKEKAGQRDSPSTGAPIILNRCFTTCSTSSGPR